MREYEVRDILDKLLESATRVAKAEIDASCCQTEMDWARLRRAHEAHAKLYEETVEALTLTRAP